MDVLLHRREWLRCFCSEDSLPYLMLTQVFHSTSTSSLVPSSSFHLPPLHDANNLLPFCDALHHHIESLSFPDAITEYREVGSHFSFHSQLSIALTRFPELDLLVLLQLLQQSTNSLYKTLLCIWGIEPTQMAVEKNEEESLSFRAFLSVRIARILLQQVSCSLPPQGDSPFERTVRFVMYKQLQLGRKRFLELVVLFRCS